jgi:hypothetical protein
MDPQNDILSVGPSTRSNGARLRRKVHELRSSGFVRANHPLSQSDLLVARARIIDLTECVELLQGTNPEDEESYSESHPNSDADSNELCSESESYGESDSDSDSDDESDSGSNSDDESDSESNSDTRIGPHALLCICSGLLLMIFFLVDAMILRGDIDLTGPSLDLYCVIHTVVALSFLFNPNGKGKGDPKSWKFVLWCLIMFGTGIWVIIGGDPNPKRGRIAAAVVYGVVLGLIIS